MPLDPSAFIADRDLILALDLHATPVDCRTERLLFQQGEPPAGLYILKSGTATLTMLSPAGTPLATTLATAGSLLGLPGVVGDKPYTLSALAHSGAQISYLSRADFVRHMKSNPAIAFKILAILAAEVRSARQAML